MATIVITGANRGIGLEAARQLVEAGHRVFLGSRDGERGEGAAEEVGAEALTIDVTDDAGVQAAVDTVRAKAGVLDVLINNAAIVGAGKAVQETTADDLAHCFATNVFGVVRVTQGFLPLLEKSANPVIVNVSSPGGSLALISEIVAANPQFALLDYSSSKSALNMITALYATTFTRFRVNSVNPGYTATGLNNFQGDLTAVEGARALVQLASIGQDGPTGGFFSVNAETVPW